jgi:hypothetical protein
MQEATPIVKAITATPPQKSKLIPPLAAVDPRKEPANAAAARSRPARDRSSSSWPTWTLIARRASARMSCSMRSLTRGEARGRGGQTLYFFFLDAFFRFEVTVVLLWLSAYFLVTYLPVFADRELVPPDDFFPPDDFRFLAISVPFSPALRSRLRPPSRFRRRLVGQKQRFPHAKSIPPNPSQMQAPEQISRAHRLRPLHPLRRSSLERQVEALVDTERPRGLSPRSSSRCGGVVLSINPNVAARGVDLRHFANRDGGIIASELKAVEEEFVELLPVEGSEGSGGLSASCGT